MKITKELGRDLVEKIEKVLGRGIYLFDENGGALNGTASSINLNALKAIQEGEERTEKREGKYFSCVPISYDDKVVGAVCAGDTKKDEAVEFSSLAKGLSEVLLYEEFLVKNIHIANDLRSDFIKEVLTGTKIKTTEEAIEQGDIIGVNLRFKYAVMILKIDALYDNHIENHKKLPMEVTRIKFQDYLKEIEENLLCAFEGEIQNCIVYIGEGKFVMLKEIKEENINTLNSFKVLKDGGQHVYKNLNKEFSGRASVAVGQYYPGLSGLRKSYEDASIALKLGEKVIPQKKVYHILDVAMFVGLLGEVTGTRANELAYQVLRKLYLDKDLLKTTSIFLECGMNLTEASKKLHLHRNTLIYRLNKVKDLIGLNPAVFHDALQIKLGLMVHDDQDVLVGAN
jgi:carbohydrate diacid regulator